MTCTGIRDRSLITGKSRGGGLQNKRGVVRILLLAMLKRGGAQQALG